eukprot:2023686-Ditylum_brightwellii.AAC.1
MEPSYDDGQDDGKSSSDDSSTDDEYIPNLIRPEGIDSDDNESTDDPDSDEESIRSNLTYHFIN